MTGPSVFGLPHLSEDAVAAFADGVLSSAATVRARRHCAECTECARVFPATITLPGEILDCPDCSAELEVRTVPLTLALAPTVEEDWGE